MLAVLHNCPLFGHFQVAMRDLHCNSLQADCPLSILPERSQLRRLTLRFVIHHLLLGDSISHLCNSLSWLIFGASARQHVPTLQKHTRFALEGYTTVNASLWPYLHGMDLHVQTVLIASSDSYQSKKTAARNRLWCRRNVSTINCLESMRGETFRYMGNHQVSPEEERILHASASPASSLYRRSRRIFQASARQQD